MSHSSGISVSRDLLERFASARANNDVRWIKAVIEEETVVYVTSAPFGKDLKSDFESFTKHLQPKEPCYIIFRLEDAASTVSSNFQRWLLVTYAPDVAFIKSKMLIASTRDNAKKQLGLNYFAMEMYGSNVNEVSYAEYEHILGQKKTEGPLTVAEIAFKSEANAEVHHGVSREYVHSVQFPMDKQALTELEKMKNGKLTFIHLTVDPEKETIDFDKSGTYVVDDLSNVIPSDSPSFTVFRWKHNFDGSAQDAYVFIYCCPPSSRVKLKMLYSTVNKAAISAIEQSGISITKKVEVESPDELGEDMLMAELHPETPDRPSPLHPSGAKFAKPARPGRGRARITKS